jgi:hypothetical protein
LNVGAAPAAHATDWGMHITAAEKAKLADIDQLIHGSEIYIPTYSDAACTCYFHVRHSLRSNVCYSVAWLNHKAKNKHHWQYWTDFENGKIIAVPMPQKYIEEMFCDMIGASRAYTKGAFEKDEPLKYFLSHSADWIMDATSKDSLQVLLEKYAGDLSFHIST